MPQEVGENRNISKNLANNMTEPSLKPTISSNTYAGISTACPNFVKPYQILYRIISQWITSKASI